MKRKLPEHGWCFGCGSQSLHGGASAGILYEAMRLVVRAAGLEKES
jgi:hypothetical protein